MDLLLTKYIVNVFFKKLCPKLLHLYLYFICTLSNSLLILVEVIYLAHGNIGLIKSQLDDLLVKSYLFDPAKAVALRSLCSRLGISRFYKSLPSYYDVVEGSLSLIDYFLFCDGLLQ